MNSSSLGGKRIEIIVLVGVVFCATLFAQEKEELVQKAIPFLSKKIKILDQGIYSDFLKYSVSVLSPDWIRNDEDLILLYKERDSLIEKISGSDPLFNFLHAEAYQWQFKNIKGNWEKYDHEFEIIGISTIFAEGELVGFTKGPVLEEIVSRIASEPYRLFVLLEEAYARSYGGEYTYLDLGPEMEAIEIADRLIAQYPESRFTKSAMKILSDALFPLTDWHVMLPKELTLVEKSDYHPFSIVGGLHQKTYPFWTDVGEPRKFLENYPESRFHNVVARIVEEPSEIMGGKSVHLVIVDEWPDEETARNAILNYLLNGIDIPHIIKLESYVVVYRFFSDPEKARRALERIKKTKPGASIREVYPQDY
jgi:hypothetical protein